VASNSVEFFDKLSLSYLSMVFDDAFYHLIVSFDCFLARFDKGLEAKQF
jgi:hypothetical protein